jgi:S1-C subfamily serine protease
MKGRGEERQVVPRIEELDSLAASDPIGTLDIISSYSKSYLDDEFLSRTALAAEKRLEELLEQSISAGRLDDAIRFASSLRSLSLAGDPLFTHAAAQAALSEPNEKTIEILLLKAEGYAQKGLYVPGILAFLRARESSVALRNLPSGISKKIDEALPLWLERAKAAGDAGALELLAKPEGKVSESQAIAGWALGVVTVQIDKGLRMYEGNAVPDKILGSGFQVDGTGYYLTNYHVVSSEVDPDYEGYSKLSIRPSGNPEARIPAKVIGWNVDLDIALLKSTEVSARTFFIPDSMDTPRGSRVYAIGSPIGLENSISSGIVSASGRRLLPRGEVIQIDVPVNPGNSGGPLLDEKGRLVGMVFAGMAGFQGLNFAMPAKWIKLILPALFEGGKAENPWLGLALAKNLDSSIDIVWEYPESRQFLPGDRLVELDGIPVGSMEDAQALLASKPLGSLAAVGIRRGDSKMTLVRKIMPAPKLPFDKAKGLASSESLLQGTTGMILEHLSGKRGEGGTYQVTRTWPGMPADESGISQGDSLKFLKIVIDLKAGSINLDISVKSRVSGYLEKTLRLSIPLETSNFL